MKIYTRGGDKGRTSLFNGGRVDKDDPRIEALGGIDELVAAIGVAKATPGADADLCLRLEALQTQLYTVMADIASETRGEGRLPADATSGLEAAIDTMDAELPALTEFVIPGASPVSAALHLARTICRRAERQVQAAAREHDLPSAVAPYLNRLSDLLFVTARWADRCAPDELRDRTFKDQF